MNKIYTKTGDKGMTSLYDGTRINKDDMRVEAYGTIDELNSNLGVAKNYIEDEEMREMIFKIQRRLFFVAGELATKDEEKRLSFKNRIDEDDIKYLEDRIDYILTKIPKVDAFIVTGTSKAAAYLHVSRTVCRRAERRMLTLSRSENVRDILIKYVNRLSDAIYAVARYSESELIYMDFDKR